MEEYPKKDERRKTFVIRWTITWVYSRSSDVKDINRTVIEDSGTLKPMNGPIKWIHAVPNWRINSCGPWV